jgi:hypothetical protein
MQKSEALLESIQKFYSSDPKNAQILIDIVSKKKGGVSLRNIEWFITNYAKKNNIQYTTNDGKSFVVHCRYKSTLDGYSKKLFDPFCRTEKIKYDIPGGESSIHTTVAQLNFIRWCIKHKVIEYIQTNKNTLFSKRTNGDESILEV